MTESMPSTLLAALFQSFLLEARRRNGAFLEPAEDDGAVLSRKWDDFRRNEAAHALSGLCRMLGIAEADMLPGEARVGDTLERLADAWASESRLITFLTSGSTGTPRECRHAWQDLLEECAFLERLFPDCRSFLTAVPCRHLYGFTFGLLLPLTMGLPVRRTLPLPTVLAGEMRRGDAVVAIPAIWGAMNLHAADGRGRTAVSATAPIPDDVLQRLEAAGFALADIFGSSETSVAGFRTRSVGPYELPPYFERSGSGILIRRHRSGGETSVTLSDHMEWTGERSFLPSGRIDHAVQVGGINVFPPLIEKKLKDLPGVDDCRIRLMRPSEGSRLKAFIVPSAPCSEQELRAALRAFVRRELPPEERPVSFTFGARIPKNDMGKDADWPIHADGGHPHTGFPTR